MNIIFVITDSICNYKRSDDQSLLPTYEKLRDGKEGFYLENCMSQATCTIPSIFSMITGKFPVEVMPDFFTFLKDIPFPNYVSELKKNGYNIRSVLCFKAGAGLLGSIINPVIKPEMFRGNYQLESDEVCDFFEATIQESSLKENNFFYVHFRAGDPKMDNGLSRIVEILKKNNIWDNSLIVFTSDHGYYDRNLYKKINLMHVNDIHQSTLSPASFIKIPKPLTNRKFGAIEERVFLLDIFATIFDYIGLEYPYKNNTKSFRPLLENGLDVNKDRLVQCDAYFIYQPLIKSCVIKDNWKLIFDNNRELLIDISLDLKEEKDLKEENNDIYIELKEFYKNNIKEANKNAYKFLDYLFELSPLKELSGEKIFLPKKQFPKELISYLKIKLKDKNVVVEDLSGYQDLNTVIIYNRLNGFGVRKLYNKYKKNTKKFWIIRTTLKEVEKKDFYKTIFPVFLIYFLIEQRKIFIQRWKSLLIQAIYFPFYINKHIKKYYR